jgi:hypothetical protein
MGGDDTSLLLAKMLTELMNNSNNAIVNNAATTTAQPPVNSVDFHAAAIQQFLQANGTSFSSKNSQHLFVAGEISREN